MDAFIEESSARDSQDTGQHFRNGRSGVVAELYVRSTGGDSQSVEIPHI
jgi:hypothetical protein